MHSLISLFSGCGGLDLGFENAGFKTLVAYDVNLSAVNSFNTNRNNDIAINADLTQISGQDIHNHIENRWPGEKPIGIIGGPPCQTFSRSNNNYKNDDIRRALPGRYAEILSELNQFYKLHFFVFENVQGITYRKHQTDFAKFQFLFSLCGFKLYEGLLNAKDFNVPQNRPRVFIVGLNENIYGNTEFIFPKPINENSLTVSEAFSQTFGEKPWPEPAFISKKIKESQIPYHPNHWTMVPRSSKFNNFDKTNTSNGRSFRKLDWDKPSYTVAYGNREIHVHPAGNRRLSIFEAMILQGFPKNYQLTGNFSQQVKQVSDAVPPPLAYHIAKSIFAILKK